MKARVKDTGEIIELSDLEYDVYGNDYLRTDLEITNEPDYWEKLKHQYAGMAMQGMLSNCEFPAYSTDGYYKHNIVNNALAYATTLVNRFKEEEND